MKIVADFNNTVSDSPEFFHGMKNLTIITGSYGDRIDLIKKFLVKHGIKAKLISYPGTWSNQSEYMDAKVWKTVVLAEMKPDVYFDDSLRVILQTQKLSPKTIGFLVVKNEIQVMKGKDVR